MLCTRRARSHSDEDDKIPGRGRKQDDADIVVKVFREAGADKLRYTRYPLGKRWEQDYVPGRVAFALAFHEPNLFPWLSAQSV